MDPPGRQPGGAAMRHGWTGRVTRIGSKLALGALLLGSPGCNLQDQQSTPAEEVETTHQGLVAGPGLPNVDRPHTAIEAEGSTGVTRAGKATTGSGTAGWMGTGYATFNVV